MIDYRYVLIRYVPDLERMEPINVGIILQGNDHLELRISPHAAKRKEVDTVVFREWRSFFEEEIRGLPAPLFQPDRSTTKFLSHLSALCDGPITLSRPLLVSVDPSRSFEDLLDSLYRRLVAPHESEVPGDAARPTHRFRQLGQEMSFEARGIRKHAHVFVGDKRLWMAYRQLINGEMLAVDKVEVSNRMGQTACEIQCLPTIAEQLPHFINNQSDGRPRRYVLLADNLTRPFTDQSPEEFSAMRDDLEREVEKIRKQGGRIIRNVKEVESLAGEIDSKLPKAVPAL